MEFEFYHVGFFFFLCICFCLIMWNLFRKRKETVNVRRANMAVYNSKKANLTAARKERMNLPITDGCYRISEFLSHPFGIQAILNTGSLQSFQSLDANTYRCILPKVELLNFEAAPVLDLRVSLSDEHCTVEMISCKVEPTMDFM